IQDQMLAYFRGKKEAGAALSNLSERELEIIKEIAVGGSSVDIAERLHLSAHTVRTHRRNILHKLGIKNTAELIHTAMENGWI
ncbi:MAG TPA: DNA-binding response regulator, partial [Cytophagales bacterium]|nr:DNA-binding response regulator [Cytophagales bacterium]